MAASDMSNGNNGELETYLNSLSSKGVNALWLCMDKMVPPCPKPKAQPALWKYQEIRPALLEAGRLVGAKEAERRVLMLVNPGLESPLTTDTVYGGLQLILPGETAPAHRHVAFALRFIIEGQDGFTAVEGEKIPMERADVILTPSWHWHDHGNEGTSPMIWLDGLDLPMFRHIPVNFAQSYKEDRYPSKPASASPLRFPWREVIKDLDAQKGDHATYHYPFGGTKLSRTLGAQVERVDAGTTTKPRQETCSFIYHCESGQGRTTIKSADGRETVFNWSRSDTFAVPAWSEIFHTTIGDEKAYLFAINDRPVVEALGFYRDAEDVKRLAS